MTLRSYLVMIIHHNSAALALILIEIMSEIKVVVCSLYNRVIYKRAVYPDISDRIGVNFKQLLE